VLSFFAQNITGHFLLIGLTNVPFRYAVSVVRDGGGYVQRRVDVTQEGAKGVVFTCVCSFKTHEGSVQERSRRAELESAYETVLRGRPPESWPEAPGIDSPL
jgi:acyl-CoA thioesterase